MAVVTSKRFDSAEALVAALRPSDPQWHPNPAGWIFRGESDPSTVLVPTAYRATCWEPFTDVGQSPYEPVHPPNGKLQVEQELRVLVGLLNGLDREGLPIPNELVIRGILEATELADDGDTFFHEPHVQIFVALAQHLGIPTRLLDWSRVSLHATYFAATGAAKRAKALENSGADVLEWEDLTVWALSTKFLDHVESLDNARDQNSPRIRRVTAPRAGNPNLHAQAGLFTLSWNTPGPAMLTEVVKQVLADLRTNETWAWTDPPPLVRLDLSAKHAPRLLRLLAYEQIDAARMFPGHASVVQAMKERGLWDKPTP